MVGEEGIEPVHAAKPRFYRPLPHLEVSLPKSVFSCTQYADCQPARLLDIITATSIVALCACENRLRCSGVFLLEGSITQAARLGFVYSGYPQPRSAYPLFGKIDAIASFPVVLNITTTLHKGNCFFQSYDLFLVVPLRIELSLEAYETSVRTTAVTIIGKGGRNRTHYARFWRPPLYH